MSTDRTVNQKPHILVVEDDHDIQEVLRMFLEMEGYSVDIEADCQSALKAAHAHSPQLVLLDYSIGELSLSDFIDSVCSINPDVRIALVSGASDLSTKAKQLGLDKFLQKPFDPEMLLQLIEDCLRAPAKSRLCTGVH